MKGSSSKEGKGISEQAKKELKSLKLNTNSSLFIPQEANTPQVSSNKAENTNQFQQQPQIRPQQPQQTTPSIIPQTNTINQAFQNQYYQQQFPQNQRQAPPGGQFNPNLLGFQQQGVQVTQDPALQRSMNNEKDMDKILVSIQNLKNVNKREECLQELSKKKESFPNLAPYLWNTFGTIALLLQEIISIYPQLSPPQLCQNASQRVCSVLGLLQCLALHPETRNHFLNGTVCKIAHIPLFLYPFLNTSNRAKPFENLRVTSLGVIGALVKGDDSEAIHFLMQTEIIPLCLRIMKRGQELSRTVATFIVQKILLDTDGLNYICQTAERFFAVATVLQNMIEDLNQGEKNDQRLLRHIIRCYLRLSENTRACEALKKCLPDILHDPSSKFITDEIVKKWHINLLENLTIIPV